MVDTADAGSLTSSGAGTASGNRYGTCKRFVYGNLKQTASRNILIIPSLLSYLFKCVILGLLVLF